MEFTIVQKCGCGRYYNTEILPWKSLEYISVAFDCGRHNSTEMFHQCGHEKHYITEMFTQKSLYYRHVAVEGTIVPKCGC